MTPRKTKFTIIIMRAVGWGPGDNEVAFRSELLPLPCSSHEFLNSQDCDGVLGSGLGRSDREVGVARAPFN